MKLVNMNRGPTASAPELANAVNTQGSANAHENIVAQTDPDQHLSHTQAASTEIRETDEKAAGLARSVGLQEAPIPSSDRFWQTESLSTHATTSKKDIMKRTDTLEHAKPAAASTKAGVTAALSTTTAPGTPADPASVPAAPDANPTKPVPSATGAARVTLPSKTPGPLHGMGYLTMLNFLKNAVNPNFLAFSLGLPIVMYLIFGAFQDYGQIDVGHANVSASILVNMAIYGVAMTSSTTGALVAMDRAQGVWRMFALTPMRPGAQIGARMIANAMLIALVVVITYVVGYATESRMDGATWVISGALMVAIATLPLMMGLAAGNLLKTESAIALISVGSVVFGFMAGMFFPLEQMGSFFQDIAKWSPFYGIMQLTQFPLTEGLAFEWTWLANALGWTAIFTIIAWRGAARPASR